MADEPQHGSDDGMTVRERRAQHARQSARKDAPKRFLRKAALPLFIVLVLTGVTVGFLVSNAQAQACPTHWHAGFSVYVPDADNASRVQEVSYRHSQYDLNGKTPFRSHMHQSDGFNQFHFEQGGLCVGLEEAFGYIDTDLSTRGLVLDGSHNDLGQAATYRNNDTARLHVYVEHISNRTYQGEGAFRQLVSAHYEWSEMPFAKALDYQLKDTERVLVVFGDLSEEQLRVLQDQVPKPSGRSLVTEV
jgi:hypothetical protein